MNEGIWSIGGKILTGVNNYSEKNRSQFQLVTANPTWTNLESNPDLSG